ncbi:MAG: DEAD/DEAH box helicase [Prevotella sp.]|nr:DEAD/DEAH box helicase [Prevotella sp.]
MFFDAIFQNQELRLHGIQSDNQRKWSKVSIHLNSKSFLSFRVDKNCLVIIFDIEDKSMLAEELRKCIIFVESIYNIRFRYNSTLEEILNSNLKEKNTFIDVRNQLIELKNGTMEHNQDFINFCKFCDKTLVIKLKGYQYTAAYYLAKAYGGFDFSVPGSGKTIITYVTYNFLRNLNQCKKILIIGPINSFNAWYDEYITCFNVEPSFTNLANVDQKDVISYLAASDSFHSEITFINIDKAWRLKNLIVKFMQEDDTMLVIDEAHKEKNPEAEITRAVLEISKHAKSRVLLTGTPMPNGYEDLYSLTKIYSPYNKIIPYNYNQLIALTRSGANALQEKTIIDSIRPFYSRVSKSYLISTHELLPPISRYIKVQMSPEQQELYNFLKKLSFEIDNDFESELNLNMMKAILIRKMQVSSNPGMLLKSIVNCMDEYAQEFYEDFDKDNSSCDAFFQMDNKIKQALNNNNRIIKNVNKFSLGILEIPKNMEAVKLTLRLISEQKKVIIWDVFVYNMESIKHLLLKSGIENVEVINGRISGNDRQESINRFKHGKSMVLIANPATLAESISLHKICQNAIYVNRNFNAAQFIQSKDRIHRVNMPLGTTATYYFLINDDTVDSIVDERLELKETRMLRILDSNEIVIGGTEFDDNSFMSGEDVAKSYRA